MSYYTRGSVLFYIWQCKSTFLCNSCSDAAELKAGNESRMPLGSFKVRLFIFVTIYGPRVWVVWFIADSIGNGLSSLSLAFGFCEYGDPESTLRALRLLHDFKLGEKSLVVSNSCRPLSHSQFSFLTMAWE